MNIRQSIGGSSLKTAKLARLFPRIISEGKALSSAAAVAGLATVLTGCSVESDILTDITDPGAEDLVPIELRLSGSPDISASTRADGDVVLGNIQFLGWEYTGTTFPTTEWKWESKPDISGLADNNRDPYESHTVSLTPKRYYNANDGTKTGVICFWPPVSIGNGATGTVLHADTKDKAISEGLIIDSPGKWDIVFSSHNSGSKTSPILGEFALKPITSQLVVKVKAKDGDYSSLTDVTVDNIKFSDISLPSKVSVFGAIKSSVITEYEVYAKSETGTGVAVPETATLIGNPVYMTPATAIPKVKVKVSDRDEQECEIQGISSIDIRTKYEITLEIGANGLVVKSVEIKPWDSYSLKNISVNQQ